MIDLHTHSTCSDGSEPPMRVVDLAHAAGCTAMALTDHDGLSGIAEARARAEETGIEMIAGCEVSCRFEPGTQHILCYFAEPGDGPLEDQLARLRSEREERNRRLVLRLNELGIPVSHELLEEEAGGGAVGRPHFAAVLFHLGAVSSYQGAFDTLLAKGGPAYIPKASVDAPTLIAAARASGALAVLAHPLSLGLDPRALEREVRDLAGSGLVGLECWYGRYSPSQRRDLAALAARHGLVATGGSDFHGSYKPELRVGIGQGDLEVPDSVLSELEERRP
ncbi:MAG: PHP domain-containing protein [Actinomycetota bacterium]|jgi:predicted metal-dependent phosphoesterase TrpH|nr:PHP domain-containing protein [Actinomycetota bacterium]